MIRLGFTTSKRMGGDALTEDIQPACRLVAAARHRHRARQTREAAAERPSRAHASHAQARATRPPALNSLHQQAKFDAFLQAFNTERPHEPIAMKCPAELYDLGYFDREQRTLQPLDNPFGPRLSPTS